MPVPHLWSPWHSKVASKPWSHFRQLKEMQVNLTQSKTKLPLVTLYIGNKNLTVTGFMYTLHSERLILLRNSEKKCTEVLDSQTRKYWIETLWSCHDEILTTKDFLHLFGKYNGIYSNYPVCDLI